jgi:hypothetical protein
MSLLSASAVSQRPFLSAGLVVLVAVAVESLFGALLGHLAPGLPILVVGVVTGSTLAALAAGALCRLGWWGDVGVRRSAGRRVLLLFVPFGLYALLPLAAGLRVGALAIAGGIAAGAVISFWKLAALGLMLRALRAAGAWRAAAVTALLFGLMHLGGLAVGAEPLPTLLLSLSYLFLGFAYAALVLRTGVVWPLMLTSTLLLATVAATQDRAAPNLAASVESILPAVVVSALLAAYGLFVLLWFLGAARRKRSGSLVQAASQPGEPAAGLAGGGRLTPDTVHLRRRGRPAGAPLSLGEP